MIPLVVASFVVLPGYVLAADTTFEQLRAELRTEGVSEDFIKSTEHSVKRMLASAAAAGDVKSVLLDLWAEGVKGRALKNAVAAVAELVESGDHTLEAAKIASGAAHKAQAEGLSGFGVGMRVRKSVQERKRFLKDLKK